MMFNGRVACELIGFGRRIGLHLINLPDRDGLGPASIARSVTFETPSGDPDLEGYYPPCLEISQTVAQSLMDELWRCGLRPSEGSGSAGAMAATEKHLKDMQTIAFRLLDSELATYTAGQL